MRKNKFISLFLVAVMVISCVVIAGVSTSATTGDVIYFDNSVTNFSNVYCYLYNNYGSNAAFPGEEMTNVSGDIWSYTVSGNYNKVIFTDGETQSAELSYAGDGQIAKPDSLDEEFTVSWSAYAQAETKETAAAKEKKAKIKTGASGTVYCQNANSSWSSLYCYMWKDGSGNNHEWPGEKMTSVGEGVWEYNYSGDFNKIIFNNGSGGNENQTSDLSFPGSGKIYDLSTNEWDDYNPSPVKITSFTADVESPTYINTSIKLSAAAKSSQGSVVYKFSVKDSSGSSVELSNSASSSVVWIPTKAGTYTLTVDVRDNVGNNNTRSISNFEVKDTANLIEPYISAFSNSLGTKTSIKVNTPVTFTAGAIGGKTGTNLLFYKFIITDPSGNDNIPYYTLSNSYSYTPTKLGKYTINAYVQNSMNDTVSRTYTYECKNDVSGDEDNQPTLAPDTQPQTQPVTQPVTQPITYGPTDPIVTVPNPVLGDVDRNGRVTIQDATLIQKYAAKLVTLDSEQLALANTDKDANNNVNVKDATLIQKLVARLISSF